MAILVIAEHDNSDLKESTHKTVSAAAEIGGDVHILVAGAGCGGVGESASKISGVAKVLVADDALYAQQIAENMSALVVGLADGYDAVLSPASTSGKNFMPRIAAALDVAQISDIVSVESADTFVRPIYAGNAMQKVKSSDGKKVITVRTTAFKSAEEGGSAGVETVAAAGDPGLTTFVSEELQVLDRPELTAAKNHHLWWSWHGLWRELCHH